MYTWPFEEGIMNSTFEKIKQAKLWVIHQKWCVTIRRLYCHNTQILVVDSMASNMQSRLARITRIILHVMCSHSSSTMLNHTFQVNPLPLWHDRGFCETTSQFCLAERRFVAGFFRRLLAYLTPHISHTYLTPHISHTYPSHHTYPTHIHSKRIPPIPRIPPIRIRSTRIPPVRIHAMRIHSKRLHQQVLQYVSHQYVSHQYVSVQHVSHQYVSMLCNAYPFKRCASAGIANVSHQYISHQYVSSTRIPPVRIHSMRIHSKSLHQQEWQWVWVSLHIISYHCYSAGMVMNIETLLFLQFLCKIINWI